MIQNAKIYLAEALISLMRRKPLEDISIKDLVKRAGVSRMTYYRYFTSKEEVLECYMDYILEEYDTQIDQNKSYDFHSYEHILDSLIFFQKYKDFVLCLQAAGMESLLLTALNDYVKKQSDFTEEKSVRCYPFYFYAGALYNIYMHWITQDSSTPATELAAIITKMDPLRPFTR